MCCLYPKLCFLGVLPDRVSHCHIGRDGSQRMPDEEIYCDATEFNDENRARTYKQDNP